MTRVGRFGRRVTDILAKRPTAWGKTRLSQLVQNVNSRKVTVREGQGEKGSGAAASSWERCSVRGHPDPRPRVKLRSPQTRPHWTHASKLPRTTPPDHHCAIREPTERAQRVTVLHTLLILAYFTQRQERAPPLFYSRSTHLPRSPRATVRRRSTRKAPDP